MERHVAKRWVAILYIIAFTALGCGAYGLYNTNHQAYLGCVRVRAIQSYATATIERSRKTLPTLSYYKNPAHKGELKTQLALLKKSEKDFTPVSCHRNIFGG